MGDWSFIPWGALDVVWNTHLWVLSPKGRRTTVWQAEWWSPQKHPLPNPLDLAACYLTWSRGITVAAGIKVTNLSDFKIRKSFWLIWVGPIYTRVLQCGEGGRRCSVRGMRWWEDPSSPGWLWKWKGATHQATCTVPRNWKSHQGTQLTNTLILAQKFWIYDL